MTVAATLCPAWCECSQEHLPQDDLIVHSTKPVYVDGLEGEVVVWLAARSQRVSGAWIDEQPAIMLEAAKTWARLGSEQVRKVNQALSDTALLLENATRDPLA